jgi:hypothetical protein
VQVEIVIEYAIPAHVQLSTMMKYVVPGPYALQGIVSVPADSLAMPLKQVPGPGQAVWTVKLPIPGCVKLIVRFVVVLNTMR